MGRVTRHGSLRPAELENELVGLATYAGVEDLGAVFVSSVPEQRACACELESGGEDFSLYNRRIDAVQCFSDIRRCARSGGTVQHNLDAAGLGSGKHSLVECRQVLRWRPVMQVLMVCDVHAR